MFGIVGAEQTSGLLKLGAKLRSFEVEFRWVCFSLELDFLGLFPKGNELPYLGRIGCCSSFKRRI